MRSKADETLVIVETLICPLQISLLKNYSMVAHECHLVFFFIYYILISFSFSFRFHFDFDFVFILISFSF